MEWHKPNERAVMPTRRKYQRVHKVGLQGQIRIMGGLIRRLVILEQFKKVNTGPKLIGHEHLSVDQSFDLLEPL